MSASSVTVRGTTDERGWPMGRARRARKIAATAAYGGGGLAAGIGALGRDRLRRAQGRGPGGPPPRRPAVRRLPRRQRHRTARAWASRSSSSSSATPPPPGMGADHRYQTVGAIIANGVSALTGRPVRLTNTAVVGAESSGLELQLANALDQVPRPHVADHHDRRQRRHPPDQQGRRRPPPRDHRAGRCAALGTEVVVGTCPDLGTIEPIPQPLRLIGRRWSPRPGRRPDGRRRRGRRPHRLAGRPARPGVRRAARTRCSAPTASTPPPPATRGPPPPCCPASTPRSASGPASPTEERAPDTRRGEGVGPVAVAAEYAVARPRHRGQRHPDRRARPAARAVAGRCCCAARTTRCPTPPRSRGGARPPRTPAPTRRRARRPTRARARPHPRTRPHGIPSRLTKRPLISRPLAPAARGGPRDRSRHRLDRPHAHRARVQGLAEGRPPRRPVGAGDPRRAGQDPRARPDAWSRTSTGAAPSRPASTAPTWPASSRCWPGSTGCRARRSTGSAPRPCRPPGWPTTRSRPARATSSSPAASSASRSTPTGPARAARRATTRTRSSPAPRRAASETASEQRRPGPTRASRACCPTSTSRWARPPRTSPRLRGISRERQDEWGVSVAEPRREGHRRRVLRARDRAGHAGRRHRGQQGRRPARRRDARGAAGPQPGVPRAGHHHGRQLLPAQRRRRRGRRHERHQGQRARADPAGPGRLHRGLRRSRPRSWASARSRRRARRWPRAGMTIDDMDLYEINEAFAAQVLPSRPTTSAWTSTSSTCTAAPSRSATRSARPAPASPRRCSTACGPRRPVRPRDDVRRWRPGHGHHLRAPQLTASPAPGAESGSEARRDVPAERGFGPFVVAHSVTTCRMGFFRRSTNRDDRHAPQLARARSTRFWAWWTAEGRALAERQHRRRTPTTPSSPRLSRRVDGHPPGPGVGAQPRARPRATAWWSAPRATPRCGPLPAAGSRRRPAPDSTWEFADSARPARTPSRWPARSRRTRRSPSRDVVVGARREGHRVDVIVHHPAFASLDERGRADDRLPRPRPRARRDRRRAVGRRGHPVAGAPARRRSALAGLRAVVRDLKAENTDDDGEPSWAILSGDGDGGPVLAMAQVPLSSATRPDLDTHVGVFVPYDDQTERGLPGPGALDRAARPSRTSHRQAWAATGRVVAHQSHAGMRAAARLPRLHGRRGPRAAPARRPAGPRTSGSGSPPTRGGPTSRTCAPEGAAAPSGQASSRSSARQALAQPGGSAAPRRRRRRGRSAGPSPQPGRGRAARATAPDRSSSSGAATVDTSSAWSSGSCCHRRTTRWSSSPKPPAGQGISRHGQSATRCAGGRAGAGSRGRARPASR